MVAVPNVIAESKDSASFGTDAHRLTGKGSHYRESRPMGTLTNIIIWGNPRLEYFLSRLAVDRGCCSHSRALSVVSTYDRLSKKFISLFAALWEAEPRESRFPYDQKLDDAMRGESPAKGFLTLLLSLGVEPSGAAWPPLTFIGVTSSSRDPFML